MIPLLAGVVPFMSAVGGSLYTCQKQQVTLILELLIGNPQLEVLTHVLGWG
jgi:hypothetical protein